MTLVSRIIKIKHKYVRHILVEWYYLYTYMFQLLYWMLITLRSKIKIYRFGHRGIKFIKVKIKYYSSNYLNYKLCVSRIYEYMIDTNKKMINSLISRIRLICLITSILTFIHDLFYTTSIQKIKILQDFIRIF